MFVGGWLDGFRVLGGWWDGFRTLASQSAVVQLIVILVLFLVMFSFIAFNWYDKRGKTSKDEDDGAVYGHRVLWDE